MNFDGLARSYIMQADEKLEIARNERSRGKYNIVVRQCQEAVELSLKGCLRLVGVEVPKYHEGPALKRERERFPEWFREKIEIFASYSRWLRSERETSMYGDEETGTPPEMLYSAYDADEALKKASEVVEWAKKLLEALST
ncbi:HEPN domain-containing protein [Metallosphaera javensis (ex Sakai et al. 2022)]|uniref:HEPN domain-containing protein n=1 Tax=Metallosphaera javensis (ex Sakai et al. 2022) TaxID=2775498 RepID=UPI00258523E9|nr:MAG: DNA-binding protein [Metallosphaera javensis (ex Sakai et al. 2022)]